jgi:hypothetical protein
MPDEKPDEKKLKIQESPKDDDEGDLPKEPEKEPRYRRRRFSGFE